MKKTSEPSEPNDLSGIMMLVKYLIFAHFAHLIARSLTHSLTHLLLAPSRSADGRIELVVPALPALLPAPPGQLHGNLRPLLRPPL